MIGVDWLMKELESHFDIRKFPNRHFEHHFLVDKRLFPKVISRTGEIYSIHPDLYTVEEVYQQYQFDDIRPNDIVIDIGANIGAFSIMASKIAKRVYAFEPIVYDELIGNIKLNHAFDVHTYKIGLGSGSPTVVNWEEHSYEIQTRTLTTIKKMCGGCDFLKCDCEGAEWYINIDELKDIRRIEIEFHFWMFPKYEAPNELVDELTQYFDIKVDETKTVWWVHGVNKCLS